jgi:hypothetical protein
VIERQDVEGGLGRILAVQLATLLEQGRTWTFVVVDDLSWKGIEIRRHPLILEEEQSGFRDESRGQPGSWALVEPLALDALLD